MLPSVEVLKAIISLAWPALTAAVLLRLLPSIKKVVELRAFTLKFAGIEVTAQGATDQIQAQLQDLKDQVIALKKASGEAIQLSPTLTTSLSPTTILWVDDRPSNNALQISQLENRGYKVVVALSTSDAMAYLSKENIGLIISDMGRREDGVYVSQAGVVFLKAARKAGHDQPFIVYSSPRYVEKNDAAVKYSGGFGATSSSTKLLEWIETYFPNNGEKTLNS